ALQARARRLARKRDGPLSAAPLPAPAAGAAVRDARARQPLLIRGAAAILTGLAGATARADASDIRVAGDGTIAELGRGLAVRPDERVLDAQDAVVYPGWVNTHH